MIGRPMPAPVRDAYHAEMRAARAAAQAGARWRHLERAHILSQPWPWPHTRNHVAMFFLALAQRDRREADHHAAQRQSGGGQHHQRRPRGDRPPHLVLEPGRGHRPQPVQVDLRHRSEDRDGHVAPLALVRRSDERKRADQHHRGADALKPSGQK
ncbi:DUF3703 domain-containing protein [Nonomuraea sp. NPDC050643]|uniref:DUF3703 domain-containing protein n=1 Tax=Nonomuraea sp. NPDC050643 TaxID=3155660 RepID=UPI0033DFB04B